MMEAIGAPRNTGAVPRSIGTLKLSTKTTAGRSGIDRFQTSGATKVVFPRRTGAVEGIMLNTSGGLTGGDRFETSVVAGLNSRLVLSTQAAERAYRSASGLATVQTTLAVEEGAVLHWLPQELIVFDGSALDRRLVLDVTEGAEAIVIEPVVFGRFAMGETRVAGTFRDRIMFRQNGTPIYWDKVDLTGDISARLDRPAIAGGMTALASGYYYGPGAEVLLPTVRKTLPNTGGASLIAPGLLVFRLLASDSLVLRQTLMPLLERLTQSKLPKSWSL